MSAFLLKFEAIESRIASYSCPRGVSGRVHSLRLRRCFAHSRAKAERGLRQLHLPPSEGKNIDQSIPGRVQVYDNRGDKGSLVEEYAGGPKAGADGALEGKPVTFRTSHLGSRGSHIFESVLQRYRSIPEDLGDITPFELKNPVPNAREENLAIALRLGNAHAVLWVLIKHTAHDDFRHASTLLESIPPTMFSEILRCIDPAHFISRYQVLQKEISPAYARVLGLSRAIDRDGYYKFCRQFLHHIKAIIEARSRQFPLTLSDYKYLLKCAREIGDERAANSIWQSIQANKKIELDADCYNHFLAVKCWQDLTNPYQRFRLRVIPDNVVPRTWESLPYSLKGHSIGVGRGIKAQASGLFRQMVEAGVSGNEETFCLMMISMAREGDVASIDAILKRVWDIDVQSLMITDESLVPPTKIYNQDSPFYPSKRLLYAIAHSYGANNNIPMALRLVDYVSRQYSVTIPTEVWNELLQWTFVLSVRPRTIKRRLEPVRHGKETGQLPPQAVSSIWDTMISEPYNVRPSMEMYNRLISNLLYRQRFGEIQIRMQEARFIFKNAIRDLSRSLLIFYSTTLGAPKWVQDQRVRDVLFAHLRVARDRQYIRRWVRLLIHHGSRNLTKGSRWTDCNLPKLILDWYTFLPNAVEYPTASGHVRFSTQTSRHNEAMGFQRKRVMIHKLHRLTGRRVAGWNQRTSPNERRRKRRTWGHTKDQQDLGIVNKSGIRVR